MPSYTGRMKRFLIQVIALLAVAWTTTAAQNPLADQLAREIAQTGAAVERVVPQDQRAPAQTRIARAKAALDAGRLHLALYELEAAFVMANAFTFVNEQAAVKTDEQFATKWRTSGEPKPKATPPADAPALVRAMAASGARRAPITYRAAMPYGQDAGVEAGLYYLGEARALTMLSDWVSALPWKREGTPPPIRSIQPELDAFDAEVTKAYEGMTQAEHSTYIVVSVLIKRARTLNDNGDYPGALFEYLLARLRFASLRKATETPADEKALADARAQLPASVDHSIARVFVEMAEAALAGTDATQRRNAGFVLQDVLPAYHAALARASKSTTTADADPDVTLTLVRWPFT